MTQDDALSILQTGANVFLTGEPGSGKTHTVNRYVSWLRARGIEPAITASTGIAATHIGGFTIHSWSGIGIKRDLSKYDLDAIGQNKNVVRRVESVSTLIIDEVSMLSARTLSMVDAVCREVRRDPRPFGGLQVILVGDFFQLPPVSRRDFESETKAVSMFKEERNGDGFAFLSSSWSAMEPLICYLEEQHRQDDEVFLSFLSAVRRGDIIDEHYALLESRHASEPAEDVTQLYSHNADVDSLNGKELAKLSGDTKTFVMETRGAEKLVAGLIRGCLSPERLFLKVGARVMFTKNEAMRRRYVNGTLGTVTGFDEESGYPVVQTNSGHEITAEPDAWRIEEGGRVLAEISQIPLRLAWAMTVHKSQGMSLDAAHMDLSHTFEYGQGYVALSRVRTLAGLSLAGLNTRALQVHPDILLKDEEFRTASEAAQEAFADLFPKELAEMHEKFVKASGGREPIEGKETEDAVPAKSYTVEEVRKGHLNAYRPWSAEEERELIRRYQSGEKTKAIAEALGRKPGAISSRIAKLGLVS